MDKSVGKASESRSIRESENQVAGEKDKHKRHGNTEIELRINSPSDFCVFVPLVVCPSRPIFGGKMECRIAWCDPWQPGSRSAGFLFATEANVRFPVLTLIPLLLTGPVFAQEPEEAATEQPTYQVTVTADRLQESITDKTDAITVITRDEIDQHQWKYVIDALRQTPGLTILQSGSSGKVTSTFLRGASATQMLVLIDGVPINNPYFGGIDLENLTTGNIERIEVLKGPQSPLYGSDSMAGVIQIFTRRGEGRVSIETSFDGGSFQTYREQAGILGAESFGLFFRFFAKRYRRQYRQ